MKTRFYILFPSIIMLLMQSGCIFEKEPESSVPSTEPESIILYLDLTVPASYSSRAQNHDTEDGIDIENMIFLGDPANEEIAGDFKVLIFDNSGAINQEIEAKDCDIIKESATDYTLSFSLDLTDRSTKDALEKFKVMVVANWISFCTSTHNIYGALSEYPTFKNYNLTLDGNSNIFKDNTNFNFRVNTDRLFQNDYWKPYYTNTSNYSLIPMFGISDEIDLENAIAMGKWGDEPSTNIKMLRSLVKVEIIDNTSDRQLKNVRMSGGNRIDGRFIPDIDANPDWNDPEIQIIFPTVPSSDKFESDEGDIDNHYYILQKQGDHKWVIYLPEHDFQRDPVATRADIGLGLGGTLIFRPIFMAEYGDNDYAFYFDNNPKSVSIPKSQNPTVSSFLAKMQSNSELARTLPYTLRNHIYRYELEESQAQLKVKSSILSWDLKWDDNPTYFDNPKMAENGYLSWVTTVFDNPEDPSSERTNGYIDNKDDLRLIMKAATDEYAEATFTLDAPLYGTWVAFLRPTSGETDAFYFTTGNLTENPGDDALYFEEGGNSGVIDGTPQHIKIACKREIVNNENNEATLLIMVQYPDNSQVEIYMVDVETTGKTNYTIVQEKTEIM